MVVCFSHLCSFPWCFDEMIALSSYVTLFSNVVGGQRTTFRNQLSSSNFTFVANYKIVILIVCHKLINVKECFPKISAEYIFPLHLMLVCQYEPFSPTLFSYLSHCYFPVELPCYVLISYNVWSQQSIGRKKNQEGRKKILLSVLISILLTESKDLWTSYSPSSLFKVSAFLGRTQCWKCEYFCELCLTS